MSDSVENKEDKGTPEVGDQSRLRYPPQFCEICDTTMYGLHCKIVCPNCGYKRDCSDP